ncbi:MAG: hypothetical protein JSW55_08980, partial [Chloroflexota bacterium]
WMLFLIIPYGWLISDLWAQESVQAALVAAGRTVVLTGFAYIVRTHLLTALKIFLLPLVRRLMGWYLSRQIGDFLTGKAS